MSAIATLGEAHDLGWRLTVCCSWGKRYGMKSIRECQSTAELDLATLIWTRGRAFPIGDLASRLKWVRCGSRRMRVLFQPPRISTSARVAAS